MTTTHVVSLDAPVETVWAALTDLDRMVAAVPGTVLTRVDGDVTGSLKVRLAGSQITYRVTTVTASTDDSTHTVVLDLTGREARGGGTIVASFTVRVTGREATATLEVTADVVATGRGGQAEPSAWDQVVQAAADRIAQQVLDGGPSRNTRSETRNGEGKPAVSPQPAPPRPTASEPVAPQPVSPRPAGRQPAAPSPKPLPATSPIATVPAPPTTPRSTPTGPARVVTPRTVGVGLGVAATLAVALRRRRQRRLPVTRRLRRG